MTRILTSWVKRAGWEEPELLLAWDEVSHDQNPEGFDRDEKVAAAAMKDDLEEGPRRAWVTVPAPEVRALFPPTAPPTIGGELRRVD